MRDNVRVIYVDLDHTLLCVDLLHERLIIAIINAPLMLFKAFFWLLRGGRALLKEKVASRYPITNAASLPFNEPLISFLQTQHQAGVRLVLATGAPQAWAQKVADHLGIFDHILATNKANGNLKGDRKLALIKKDAQGEPFGYVGDSSADRPIFEASQLPVVVGGGAEMAGKQAAKAIVIDRNIKGAKSWWMALRPHQWCKNALVFTPLVTAHQIGKFWPEPFVAFSCFCLVASALYLLNDLYDIERDRQHPEKRLRSLAVGNLLPSTALFMASSLIVAAGLLSMTLPYKFGIILLCYGVTNIMYSHHLKHIVVLDVVTLAFLYSIRVFAGGAACGIPVSTWLAVFAFFLALSLTHLKRYVELTKRSHMGLTDGARPAYTEDDKLLLAIAGMGAGLISVMVMAVYMTSPQVYELYATPRLLIIICMLQIYWIERLWIMAFRGSMLSDPIAFIIKDKVSYGTGILVLALLWAAVMI